MAKREILSSKIKVGILLLMNRRMPVCGYIETICRLHFCTNGFIPVDERDCARMQFLRHSRKRHDCAQMVHFSVMNCSSTGSFYEWEFSPWRLFVHKNQVCIWLILRWLFSNGRAPFTNGQFGWTGTNICMVTAHICIHIVLHTVSFFHVLYV